MIHRAYLSGSVFMLLLLNILGQTGQLVNAQSASMSLSKLLFVGDDRQIYIVNSDGTQKQALTTNHTPATDVSWSPNGKEILFCACSDTTGDDNTPFYVMDIDSSRLIELGTTAADFLHPVWSPDGQQIAFLTYTEDGWQNLFIIDKDGTHKKLITTVDTIQQFSWSPNGAYLGFVVWDADSAYLEVVNTNDFVKSEPLAGGILRFSWSPDSTQIAWWANGARGGYEKIGIINLLDNTQAEVHNGYLWGLAWLSNSQKLLFSSEYEHDKYVYHHLFSVEADGSNLTNLTHDNDLIEDVFAISSSESKLAILSVDAAGKYYLVISNIDGTQRQKLVEVDKRAGYTPQWSPDDQHIAYITGDPKTHWYLNVIDATGQNSIQIGKILGGNNFEWQPVNP